MAQHSQVPKFGNWDIDQDVPYTQYFEKTRKGKSAGKMINPNDPQDNMDEHTDSTRPVQASPLRNSMESEVRIGEGAPKPRHERRLSKEDGDFRRLSDSPARYDTAGRKTNTEHHRTVSSGEAQNKPRRQSGGQDRSIDHSPLHPHYQARTGGKGSGVSSPAWERKSSEGSHAPNTPGRSRLRSVARGDETPDKSAAVPKFGEWDESNPASADGFTHIFNKMREEKQSGSANVIPMPDDTTYSNGHTQDNSKKSAACCCFSWCKK